MSNYVFVRTAKGEEYYVPVSKLREYTRKHDVVRVDIPGAGTRGAKVIKAERGKRLVYEPKETTVRLEKQLHAKGAKEPTIQKPVQVLIPRKIVEGDELQDALERVRKQEELPIRRTQRYTGEVMIKGVEYERVVEPSERPQKIIDIKTGEVKELRYERKPVRAIKTIPRFEYEVRPKSEFDIEEEKVLKKITSPAGLTEKDVEALRKDIEAWEKEEQKILSKFPEKSPVEISGAKVISKGKEYHVPQVRGPIAELPFTTLGKVEQFFVSSISNIGKQFMVASHPTTIKGVYGLAEEGFLPTAVAFAVEKAAVGTYKYAVEKPGEFIGTTAATVFTFGVAGKALGKLEIPKMKVKIEDIGKGLKAKYTHGAGKLKEMRKTSIFQVGEFVEKKTYKVEPVIVKQGNKIKGVILETRTHFIKTPELYKQTPIRRLLRKPPLKIEEEQKALYVYHTRHEFEFELPKIEIKKPPKFYTFKDIIKKTKPKDVGGKPVKFGDTFLLTKTKQKVEPKITNMQKEISKQIQKQKTEILPVVSIAQIQEQKQRQKLKIKYRMKLLEKQKMKGKQKPSLKPVALQIPLFMQRQVQELKQKQIVRQRLAIREKLREREKLKPLVVPQLKLSQGQVQEQALVPKFREFLKLRLKPPEEKTAPRFYEETEDRRIFEELTKSVFKPPKRIFEYEPSLTAISLNIRDTIPKRLTGLEIRPIRKKKRARRRKKR